MGIDGSLITSDGQKLGKVSDMTIDGKPVLGDLKITPLNALKYKVVDFCLLGPDTKSLGNIKNFMLGEQKVVDLIGAAAVTEEKHLNEN